MRVLVVGAGAAGSLLGGTLAVAGHDVAFLDRTPVPAGTREPLVVVDPAGRRTSVAVGMAGPGTDGPAVGTAPGSAGAGPAAPLPWVRAEAGLAPELIVVAVKQFDLPSALDACAGWPMVSALTVQNGVGAEEAAAAARPAAGLVAGSLTAPVQLRARAPGPATDALPGERTVHWLSRGGLGLAPVRGDVTPLIGELVAGFRAAGLRTAILPDARAMKWSKLVANLVGNATSAILDLDPGDVYADRRLFEVERRQLVEALAVMRALGLRPVELPGADVRLLALASRVPASLARAVLRLVVGGARGGKMPSLRGHVRAGAGPSEARWLNGAVAENGRRTGVPTPVNERLAVLVDEVAADPARRAWFAGRPDRLLGAMGIRAGD